MPSNRTFDDAYPVEESTPVHYRGERYPSGKVDIRITIIPHQPTRISFSIQVDELETARAMGEIVAFARQTVDG